MVPQGTMMSVISDKIFSPCIDFRVGGTKIARLMGF